jgi:hypothetical protein
MCRVFHSKSRGLGIRVSKPSSITASGHIQGIIEGSSLKSRDLDFSYFLQVTFWGLSGVQPRNQEVWTSLTSFKSHSGDYRAFDLEIKRTGLLLPASSHIQRIIEYSTRNQEVWTLLPFCRQGIIGESAVDASNVRLEIKRSGREIIDETSYCTFKCSSEDQEVWTSITCVESYSGDYR